MLNDHLANMMSHINNSEKKRKKECSVKPNSKLIRNVLDILKSKKYIDSYKIEIEKSRGGLINLNLNGNINKCGAIKPRFAVPVDGFEKFEKRYLPASGFGILIVSTNKGIMTHEEAMKKQTGGKLLAYCY